MVNKLKKVFNKYAHWLFLVGWVLFMFADSDFIILNNWFHIIVFSLMPILFIIFNKIFMTRQGYCIIAAVTIWFGVIFIIYHIMYSIAKKHEPFVTPPCKVTWYNDPAHRSGKGFPQINIIYKNQTCKLSYTDEKLDSLCEKEGVQCFNKITAQMQLREICPTIYYMEKITTCINND